MALPPATPLTCQSTAALLAFETAAVNCFVAPVCTDAVPGVTVTLTVFGVDGESLQPDHVNASRMQRHASPISLRKGIWYLLSFWNSPLRCAFQIAVMTYSRQLA